MIDLEIRTFKNNLIAVINQTELPMEVKRLVLSEVYTETSKVADSDIRIQIQHAATQKENVNPEKSPE